MQNKKEECFMKIKTKISYYEGYLPTKRHRKLRYREIEEEVELSVNKVSEEETKTAFLVKDGSSVTEIKLWNNELWKKVLYSEKVSGAKGLYPVEEFLKSINYYSSPLYPPKDESQSDRETAILSKEKYIQDYLLIDDEVYKKTSEPRYVVMTFGLGHNHGGTSLMIDGYYNSNISKDCYFNALERNRAIKEAKETAIKRGDTESIDSIGEYYNIEVLIPEAVKCNPQKEHGEGDPFINKINDITKNASSSTEAGLMAMALTFAEIGK